MFTACAMEAIHHLRSRRRTGAGVFLPAVLALILSATLTVQLQAGFDEQVTLTSDTLMLANLTGEVVVVGHAGADFELDIRVRGADATRENVQVEVQQGERGEVFIALPFERTTRVVYPEMGHGTNLTITVDRDDDSYLEERLAEHGVRKIKIEDGGRGIEAWADITVRVPAGKRVVVAVGAGTVEAQDVASGLDIDVWSGHVTVEGVDGFLNVDTGSGHVEAERIHGEVEIDTGSGHVSLIGCDGPEILIDTGSGHVEAEDVICREFEVDTGSGHVTAREVSAERVNIDTGSGRVRLDLVRMGDGPFRIDTGSGGIKLRMPEDASATVIADTGSGGIRVDVDDARILHMEDDEIEFEVGNGDARVDLDTGSGSITIATM